MSELLYQLQEAVGERYVVDREIGRGGMATVFGAEQQHPRRQVAIKVLAPELAGGIGRERFLREVEFASQLIHPNIIPIFAAEEIGDLLYYVMPYIDGQSLRWRLATEGKLSLDETLNIAAEVGDALHYAHMQGIVHRDVKPENILLANGHAMVADFGIARALCVACGDNLTVAGIPIGTPGYMSPEQAKGLEVDPRSDLYSLGCVVYEMLTGKPPFRGPTVEAIIAARYSQPTPTLGQAGWTISHTIDQAVQRSMALDRDARFETVAEFMEKLRPRISSEALAASLASNTLPPTLDALAPPNGHKAVAVLPFTNLSADPENEYFSDGITDDIITQLSKIAGLEVTSRTSVMQYKNTDKSLGQIGGELAVGAVLEGSVRRAGNRVRVVAQLVNATTDKHLWADSFDRELTDIFEIQSEIAEHIASALRATLTPNDKVKLAKKPTDNLDAYHLYLQGKFYWNRFTVEGVEKAIQFFTQAAELDESYALAHAGLSDCYILLSVTLGKLPPHEGLPKAKQAALKALELDDTLGDAYATLGAVCMWDDWDWQGADIATQRALELDPEGEKSRVIRAFYLAAMGRHDDAIDLIERAVKACPVSLLISVHLGLQQYFAGRFGEAVESLERTREMDSNFPPVHYSLGWSYLQLGRFDEAVAAAERAIELAGNTPQRRAALGCALAMNGRSDEADDILSELEAQSQEQYVSAADIAMLNGHLGRIDQAFEWLHRAVEQHAPWLGFLQVDPIWKPLQSDRRFAAIAKSVGVA